ncbi:hypothetical protein BXA17_20000 [Acinetobacter baumannii]|nr:hypothetical protein BXA17_20000 [Acinetobacter baumannii]
MLRQTSIAWPLASTSAGSTGLDIEDEAVGALCDLLAHDRRSDQRDGLDGAGNVAQGVELLVSRG